MRDRDPLASAASREQTDFARHRALMHRCPGCSTVLRRSRGGGPMAMWRKRLTSLRPHWCANCGWRAWLPPIDPTAGPSALTDTPLTTDLFAVDSVLLETPGAPPSASFVLDLTVPESSVREV